jgi:hypothetical protein
MQFFKKIFLVLTEKNYDNMIKLMKISPTQLFKFNFTLSKKIEKKFFKFLQIIF